MKRISLIIGLASGFFSVFAQQNVSQHLFKKANEDFLSGYYTLARESYEKINPKNFAIYLNIGNCFFNEKNYAQALLAWKRAEKKAGWFELSALFALEQKALKNLNIQTPSWIQNQIEKIRLIFITSILIRCFLCFILGFLLFFLFRCWQFSLFRSCNKWVVAAFILSILGCFLMWNYTQIIWGKGQAIVVKQDIVMYAGPEKTFHQKLSLPLGSQVFIKQSQQGMHQISYERVLGWIPLNSIEFV